MRNLLATVIMSLVGFSAMAEVYVPYNQWTYLPHCGGYTKLVCPDIENAKQQSQCEIKFSDSYACNQIKLYVGYDYHPKYSTVVKSMEGSFYVDYAKINKVGSDNFRTYMYSTTSDTYEQVYYQFNY